MNPVISIGAQDFKTIRENGYFYIDKTSFIKEWWENGDNVTLITRPRRFGKTLNLSMVEQFFSIKYAGCGSLFEGLSIWNEEKYRKIQGTYPVIFLSFADIKANTFKMARMGIIYKLVKLYSSYHFVSKSSRLNDKDTAYFDSVGNGMTDAAASVAVHYLSDYLCRYYGKKVIILLDEYDTPLQEAYVNGYWDEMVSFTRSLFNSTFKTNPYLGRGLMTGITRVSKESVFSDLNNLEVVTATSCKYETAFGFTEGETKDALDQFGRAGEMEKVKSWYDGFRFGNKGDIYNPWSVTKYLDSGKFGGYWANTSSNSLVGKLVKEGDPEIKITMEQLIAGKEAEVQIDEEIVFSYLDYDDTAIWSLLLASGYLKADSVPEDGIDGLYKVSLVNYEIRKMFEKIIRGWFKSVTTQYNSFIKALIAGDIEYMNQYMGQIALQVFSSFDTGKHPSGKAEPERFYHGFVLGLIVDLVGKYHITSNRESGFGRYDVMLEPLKDMLPAIIIEFKVFNKTKEKDLKETVQNALSQIEDKCYDTGLIVKGIAKERIRHYGFAFEGKNVLIG